MAGNSHDGMTSVIAAVADGHGSAKYVRSADGSRFAVEAAIYAIRPLALPASSLTEARRKFEEHIPLAVTTDWRRRVDRHLLDHPLTPDELAVVGDSAARDEPWRAYGTTLLAAIATPEFVACLQLGDGDMLVVTDAGKVRTPFVRDPRLIANETTSMISPEPWKEMRTRFQALAGDPPALIMLTTDGYSNSFASDEAFQRVGPDILHILGTEGAETVTERMDDWLRRSAAASGDDATIAILVRQDLIAVPAPSEPLRRSSRGKRRCPHLPWSRRPLASQ